MQTGTSERHRDVRVLVVDDEAIIRENLATFLEDENFAVVSAASAEQALEILPSACADVGVIDIRLPGLDGNQLILSAHRLCPDMKFLIHTGSLEYVLPAELRAMGMSERHILRKPVGNMYALVDAIDHLTRWVAT